MFPQRFVSSFSFCISNMFFASTEEVLSRFSCIFWHNILTQIANDFISDSCSPANPFISCVAWETIWSWTISSAACSWHWGSQDLSQLLSTSLLYADLYLGIFELLFTNFLQFFSKDSFWCWWDDNDSFSDVGTTLLFPEPSWNFLLLSSPSLSSFQLSFINNIHLYHHLAD